MKTLIIALIIIFPSVAQADCWGINQKVKFMGSMLEAENASKQADFYEITLLKQAVLLITWDKICNEN